VRLDVVNERLDQVLGFAAAGADKYAVAPVDAFENPVFRRKFIGVCFS